MKFFNRVAFICNISFLLSVILGNFKGVENYQAVTGTVIILSLASFLINVALIINTAVIYLIKKENAYIKNLFMINLVCFIAQVILYFAKK